MESLTTTDIVPSVRENPTLERLLFALKAADEEIESIDFDTQLEFLEAGRVKVDNYKFILDRLEVHAEFLRKREAEYQRARKTTESNIERLKKHLLFALEKNGFDRFTGNEYAVTIRKAPPTVVIKDLVEASAEHKLRYPAYVRTSYAWDKTALRDAIKAGNETVAQLAELKENTYVKFSIAKE